MRRKTPGGRIIALNVASVRAAALSHNHRLAPELHRPTGWLHHLLRYGSPPDCTRPQGLSGRVVTLPVASITGRCAHGANRLQALGWDFVLPNSKRSEQQHWCRRCHSTRTRRTLSEHRFGGIAATLMFLRHVGHVVKYGQHSERLHADVLTIGQAITARQQPYKGTVQRPGEPNARLVQPW